MSKEDEIEDNAKSENNPIINTNDENKELTLPKEKKVDKLYDTFKMGLSLVPLLPDLFGMLVNKPIDKRRDLFLKAIATKLVDLEEDLERFKPANLIENEVFVSTLTKSVQAAILDHEIEKVSSYKNVIINSVYIEHIEKEIKMLILKTLESLSGIHIVLLNYYVGKSKASQRGLTSWKELYQSFKRYKPLSKITEEVFIAVSKDLETKNLMKREKNYNNEGEFSYYFVRESEFGNMVHKYINGFFYVC